MFLFSINNVFHTHSIKKCIILFLCLTSCSYGYSAGSVTDSTEKPFTTANRVNCLFATSVGYGKGETSDASLQVNYDKKKFSFWGNYSFLRTNQRRVLTYSRSVIQENDSQENALYSEGFPVDRNHDLHLGVGYRLNHKTTINSLVSGYDNRRSMNTMNDFRIINSAAQDTLIRIKDNEVNHWKHFMTNVNVQHSISSKQRLSLDANFLYYWNNSPVQLNSEYFNEENTPLLSSQLRSVKRTPIHFWILSGNYSAELNRKLSMELGIKATTLKFQNDLAVEKLDNGNWVKDYTFSPTHFLFEKIEAAYSSIDYRPDSTTMIKGGLRFEYTQSNLMDDENKTTRSHQYGRLFPELSFIRTMDKEKSIFLSYNSKITRPTFNDIASHVFFLEPDKLFSGNPFYSRLSLILSKRAM